MVLGNLTDLCLTLAWFLMISGNPSSKCQRVWLQIRPTFDTSICTKLTCSSSQARVQKCLSGKLQVSKVLGGRSSIFQVVNLLISMENYITCDFQGDGGLDSLPSFGSAHASSLKLSSHTYVFSLCVTPLYTAI